MLNPIALFLRLEQTVFIATVVLCCVGVKETLAASVPSNNPVKTPFSFDDIFDSRYRSKGFGGSWINGTNFLYRNESGIMNFNAENEQQTVFVDDAVFDTINPWTYYVSDDLQFVLFAYDRTKLWRHSYNASYAAYNVETKAWTFLPSGGLQNKTLQYCNWSPSGHALAFVYDNNLYYQSTPDAGAKQITTNGEPLYVFNGVPDWLYEEDVLSSRVTHYWSPTSQFIVYAEMNDTEVPLQSWPVYGFKSQVYTQVMQIAYPKAGDVRNNGTTAGPNTKVKLFVVDTSEPDLENSVKKRLLPPTSLRDLDHYFVQVKWRNNETVMVTWSNRVQNQHFTYIYDATNSSDALDGQLNYKRSVTNEWLDSPPADPMFINDGADYVTILPHSVGLPDSDSKWLNLARVSASDTASGNVTFLMKEADEVQYIVGHDSTNNHVYFVSTNGDPLERHIKRLDANGDESQTPVCLTCDQPDTCRYMSGSFSTTGDYYFLNCYGPGVPNYSLRKANGDVVRVLEDNQELQANLDLKLLPTREFINVSVGGGFTGRAEIFWPPGHEEGKKYPLLVYVYAGPGSQVVRKTFPMGGSTSNWLMYLKSFHNVAVASLDGRGSMAAGEKIKYAMYKNLSVVEIADQITGGAYFRGLEKIDESIPSAIFGWSYGGGVAAHVIGDTSATFTCGISVAPVTTKAYYDTAYTERYLGLATKDDNEVGYMRTDVMNKAANFINKTYMIAHGTADDNVHFMHHAHLVRALSDAGVKFRQNLYADEAHSINTNPRQSRHLYASMTDLLVNDCWPTLSSGTPPPPTVAPTVSAAALNVVPDAGYASMLLLATVLCRLVVAGRHLGFKQQLLPSPLS